MKEQIKIKAKKALNYVVENPFETILVIGTLGLLGMALRPQKTMAVSEDSPEQDDFMNQWIEHCNSFEYEPTKSIIDTTSTETL
jgi:hypothetical protein